MKPRSSNKTNRALTLIEVLVVILILAVLVIMLLPASTDSLTKARAMRIYCVNNLKETGLAYRVWEGDHGDKYPMQVSITDTNGGGTMELASGRNAWINFAIVSNELSTPKILWCPADTDRTSATNFTTDFNNRKVSYFVNLDAAEIYPQMFLSGDDNFAIGGIPVKSCLLELSTNAIISWTAARHKNAGNIGLADGSVQMLTQDGLRQAVQQTGLATNRLAIP